ncbi:hypothetical protein [Streptomyces sp. cg36]|uniref:hypothetical protein n=1 Tax=Streptomyces sp. cg36 TaxID=3238798 RepID=UPI0034E29C58
MESHIPHAGPGAHCHECWLDQQAKQAEAKAKAEARERAGEQSMSLWVVGCLAGLVVLAIGLWPLWSWALFFR